MFTNGSMYFRCAYIHKDKYLLCIHIMMIVRISMNIELWDIYNKREFIICLGNPIVRKVKEFSSQRKKEKIDLYKNRIKLI